jgi:3-phosphoshikimate 1-carboxyvinyltransferase
MTVSSGMGPQSPVPVYTVRRANGLPDGAVQVPGSKSLTNRALICAALANGESYITNLAPGDDSVAMKDILVALGVQIDAANSFDASQGAGVRVGGHGGVLPIGPLTLFAGLAGTTSRFVTALCALGTGPYVVDGFEALRGRPMGPLHQAVRDLGVQVRCVEQPDHLPVEISGPIAPDVRSISLRGDISSQYLSAVMMIAPMLTYGLVIQLVTPLVSRPYVELTAGVMRQFGAQQVEVGESQVMIGPGGYAPASYVVEPDASSASYPLALTAICGGEVQIVGLGSAALQGDVRFVELLAAMGCDVRWSEDAVWLGRDPQRPLKGIEVDMADISDLVPTMAVVAAIAETATTISGVGFIRNKESDRLGDLVAELAVLGVDAEETDDGVMIRPSSHRLRSGRVATHHDHRLAMAFAVLGAVIGEVEIENPEVVTKSWPGFFAEFESWYPHL